MKIGVCALAKNENLYIREWVEHHLQIGFDKVFIYDNNDVEKPEGVIYDYLMSNQVELVKWPDMKLDEVHGGMDNMYNILYTQTEAYNHCIQNHQDFDWIAFIDIDEYIQFTVHSTIQEVIENNPNFSDFDAIILSWKMMGDPNALYYDPRPLTERFTTPLSGIYAEVPCNECVKSIVNIKSGVIFGEYYPRNVHSPDTKKVCNGSGNPIWGWDGDYNRLLPPHHDCMWVDHYYTKSLIEYLIKSINSTHRWYNLGGINYEQCITQYKNLNGWSDEHEKVYQDFLKRHS